MRRVSNLPFPLDVSVDSEVVPQDFNSLNYGGYRARLLYI